jgi:poly-beta-1,6-N-acetyl-D-glucosamine synthase
MSERSYIVVSPVRNEAEHLPGTIQSLACQTIRPALWVIVNDGSTDNTGAIADAAAQEYPWIRVVHRKDRGFRKSGGGVIEAFYDGYALIGDRPWDYLVKLDGDLSFDERYFEACMAEFEREPKLGIGGGNISNLVDGILVTEWAGDPPFHVRGATKIYRRRCWDEIGGLIREAGWDTLDEVKANMLGWRTYTFPAIRLRHHRLAGAADGNWKNWFKNGRANYVCGYHPLFLLAKCAHRAIQPPFLVAAAGLFSGFFSGYLKQVPQVDDRPVIRYLRKQQLNRMFARKSIWDAPA